MLIQVRKILLNKNKTFVELLPMLPPDFKATDYSLMKRGEYFYLLADNYPLNNSNDSVARLNFILKSKDLINWTGSGIGSGTVRYDEQSDSFFATTLTLYSGKTSYRVTKINPDDFSYTITTVMQPITTSGNSTGVSPVQRVGNYLMFQYYTGTTTNYVVYSLNNGTTWSSEVLGKGSRHLISGNGLVNIGNGTKTYMGGPFNSSGYNSNCCFSSPTSYTSTSAYISKNDKFYSTAGENVYGYISGSNTFYLTNDLISNYDSFSVKPNTINLNCKFYNNHLISTCSINSTLKNDNQSHIGNISIYDLATKKLYLFNTGLKTSYTKILGSNEYIVSDMQIIGFVDDYIYFIFKSSANDDFQFARVPVDYVLKKMVICDF